MKRDPEHEAMTKLAHRSRCLVCGMYGCDPAHWPVHHGMGGAKAGWSVDEIVPLCRPHHDLVDQRTGVSAAVEERRRKALAMVVERAPKWREANR